VKCLKRCVISRPAHSITRLGEWAAESEEIHTSSEQYEEHHSEQQRLRTRLWQWDFERSPELNAKEADLPHCQSLRLWCSGCGVASAWGVVCAGVSRWHFGPWRGGRGMRRISSCGVLCRGRRVRTRQLSHDGAQPLGHCQEKLSEYWASTTGSPS